VLTSISPSCLYLPIWSASLCWIMISKYSLHLFSRTSYSILQTCPSASMISYKITELWQQSSELKDELARVTKELESNLVMTETMTLPTQVKLKRVGRGGKWQPWVIQYICELFVIGTPPASIPSIISTSYQTYYGKEPDEVPQISFVRQCRVIVQVIGKTITAIKLASAEKWDQLWTDATT